MPQAVQSSWPFFQFAVGAGTLAVLSFSGEMLSEKPFKEDSQGTPFLHSHRRRLALVTSCHVFFLFQLQEIPPQVLPSVSALEVAEAGDVVLQGLVILTVALGLKREAVLVEKEKGGRMEWTS